MALYRFTRAILAGEPIDLYNQGDMARDFTYIDDIVESLLRLRLRPPAPASSAPPCQLFNIGRGAPVQLTTFIECLEQALGVKAMHRHLPMQPGDVPRTWADIGGLAQWIDYSPKVPIEQGVAAFVAWYKEFHRL
jgi:UDP-glucuronate 4-epimerase